MKVQHRREQELSRDELEGGVSWNQPASKSDAAAYVRDQQQGCFLGGARTPGSSVRPPVGADS